MNEDRVFVFLVSVACGVIGGALYEPFRLFNKRLRRQWVRYALDVLFCVLFAILYLCISVRLAFPDLRAYSLLSCLLGFGLYAKSLHKTVAFLEKKIYNKLKQLQKEKRTCQKEAAPILQKKRSGRS